MTEVNKRNTKVENYLEVLYEKANNDNYEIDESNYMGLLDTLFTTTTWGYREILLVVIVGIHLNDKYEASTDFYECSPRAIFEGPIKKFLISKGIPHRKSGPLNIAKATQALDSNWASRRGESDIANNVVKLVQYLEKDDNDITEKSSKIGVSLIRRLLNEKEEINKLSVNISPSEDPVLLYNFCYELITKSPDEGNTPQKIAFFLLESFHKSLDSGIKVTGGEDRASVTSTTSKKPGDVNEEFENGNIYKVYEITVKPFDLPRIIDSYDTIRLYNENNSQHIHEIIVICREEDSVDDLNKSDLKGYMGSYEHNDLIYYYWNIWEWIANLLQRMDSGGRMNFYSSLNDYINDFNTSASVKLLWKELHTH